VPETKIPFVERLLALPTVRVRIFAGLSLLQAAKKLVEDAEILNVGNPWLGETSSVYDLRRCLGMWKAIGADRSVMSFIGYGVPMRFESPVPRTSFRSVPLDVPAKAHFDKDCTIQLASGRYRAITPEAAHVVHPVFVLKQGAKLRRIDDMRFANGFMASPWFRLQSLEKDVKNVVEKDDVLLTKDFASAYHRVCMEPSACAHQCFWWNDKIFCTVVMLFGWCLAPFYFAKICKVPSRFFGALLIKLLNYLDDFLFSGTTEKMEDISLFVNFVLVSLGWSFND